MSGRLQLETFDVPDAADSARAPDEAEQPPLQLSPEELEELRAQAREDGFRAGVEAGRAQSRQDDDRRREALEEALLTLSFTYHEARDHILGAITPLLHAMVHKVVPETAQAALAAHLDATLVPVAETLSEPPVTIVVNPAARADIEAVLARAEAPPSVVQESVDLGPAQLHLRFDSQECRIDLDDVVERMSAILREELGMTPAATGITPVSEREKDARNG